MNGPHDLGGQMGFGPVLPEADEPIFHAEWEKRALALTLAAGALGAWTIDESRHARENLPPALYYTSRYYEIWIHALCALLERHDLASRDEMARGQVAQAAPHAHAVHALKPENVASLLAKGAPYDRAAQGAPRFAAGDRVLTKNMHPRSHTRLPRYARARQGIIEAVRGYHVLPDSNAEPEGRAENPQWLYTVVFDTGELWGQDGERGLTVSIDAWESYLEPASP